MILAPKEYSQLQELENSIASNFRIGGYNMDKICPIEEGAAYQISLEQTDVSRLFLLGEPTFTELSTQEKLSADTSD